MFVAGRILFWRGYAQGAPSRALGFALTFYPSVALLVMMGGWVALAPVLYARNRAKVCAEGVVRVESILVFLRGWLADLSLRLDDISMKAQVMLAEEAKAARADLDMTRDEIACRLAMLKAGV